MGRVPYVFVMVYFVLLSIIIGACLLHTFTTDFLQQGLKDLPSVHRSACGLPCHIKSFSNNFAVPKMQLQAIWG
eukprot:5945028-Amphidinium_carterae.1